MQLKTRTATKGAWLPSVLPSALPTLKLKIILKKAVDAAIQALLNEINKKFQDITYVAVLETRIEKLEAEAEQKKEDQPDMNGNLQTTLEAIKKDKKLSWCWQRARRV